MSVAADRPKSRSLGPLRALVPYLRPYRGVLVLALLALLVAAAAMLALPIALRYLIDNGISSKSSDTINQYFVAFLAAAAIFGVFAALRFYLVTWLGERVVADMRSAVYARVIRALEPGLAGALAPAGQAVGLAVLLGPADRQCGALDALHRALEGLDHGGLDLVPDALLRLVLLRLVHLGAVLDAREGGQLHGIVRRIDRI